MEFERILVAGAGAIGSVMGAMMRAHGHRVTLLGRRPHLAAIARLGLRVTGVFGECVATGFELADDPAQIAQRFPLILCAVKSYDTAAIAPALSTLLEPEGVIVSMQNGLGNIETLAQYAGRERVLGGRVIFGAEIPAPGAAHVTVIAEPVAVGPWPAFHREAAARLEGIAGAIAAILDEAGVPTRADRDIMPAIWTKLLYNAALNPLGALLRLHYGALAQDADLRAVMDAVIDESFAVARSSEVKLPFRDTAEYRDVFYNRLIPPTHGHRPSMLHDL